jgi:hypothetical protein
MISTDNFPGDPIQYGWVCPLCHRVMSPATHYCCFCNPSSTYPLTPPIVTLPTWPPPNLEPAYTVTSAMNVEYKSDP